MEKTKKIIYWIATVWLILAMMASGIQQIFSIGGFAQIMDKLGYPPYFSVIIGLWKIPGCIVLLSPKMALVKEWTYAGFVFLMTGAIASHIAVGDGAAELFAPVFLLVLTITSWYLRPPGKKLHTL